MPLIDELIDKLPDDVSNTRPPLLIMFPCANEIFVRVNIFPDPILSVPIPLIAELIVNSDGGFIIIVPVFTIELTGREPIEIELPNCIFALLVSVPANVLVLAKITFPPPLIVIEYVDSPEIGLLKIKIEPTLHQW